MAPSHGRLPHIEPGEISLQELEPSPVEEKEYEFDSEKATDSYLSSSVGAEEETPRHSTTDSSSGSASTSTLGLSSSTISRTLQTLQKYSTYPFLFYAAIHITNTSFIPLWTRNLHTADSYLLLTRPYYQSPILEKAVVFGPLAIHVLSGIALRVYRRRIIARRHGAETHRERKRIPWPKLSLQSAIGYLLYPLVVGHMYINRILPLQEEGGSSGVGLRFVAHGFTKHPYVDHIGYGVLIALGSWHIIGGTAKWLRVSQEYVTIAGDYGRKVRRRRGWIINGLSAAVALIWMAGGLGIVGRGGKGSLWEARGWDALYKKVPVIGNWMA